MTYDGLTPRNFEEPPEEEYGRPVTRRQMLLAGAGVASAIVAFGASYFVADPSDQRGRPEAKPLFKEGQTYIRSSERNGPLRQNATAFYDTLVAAYEQGAIPADQINKGQFDHMSENKVSIYYPTDNGDVRVELFIPLVDDSAPDDTFRMFSIAVPTLNNNEAVVTVSREDNVRDVDWGLVSGVMTVDIMGAVELPGMPIANTQAGPHGPEDITRRKVEAADAFATQSMQDALIGLAPALRGLDRPLPNVF